MELRVRSDTLFDNQSPRLSLRFPDASLYEVSPITDLVFADTRLFPQEIQDKLVSLTIEETELLEDNSIFLEYYPFIGLRQNVDYPISDYPLLEYPLIPQVLGLCHDQLYSQDESQPLEIEV